MTVVGAPVRVVGKNGVEIDVEALLQAIATSIDGGEQLTEFVDGLEALATSLNGYVDGIEVLIGTTNITLATLGGYVDGLEALATAMNGYVDGMEALAASTNTKLDTVVGHVDGLETLATALNGYVDDIETLATATNTKLDSLIAQAAAAADLKYLPVSVALSGDNQLLAAVSGKKFAIVSYVLVGDAAVTAKFRSNSVDLSGAMSFAANGGASARGSRAEPLMITGTANQALNLTLGGATGVRGHLTYIEV